MSYPEWEGVLSHHHRLQVTLISAEVWYKTLSIMNSSLSLTGAVRWSICAAGRMYDTPAKSKHSRSIRYSDTFTGFKVPLLWVMKDSYFTKQVDMHSSSKTLSYSYNMHLILAYLLNDSQTIHFSKLLLCVTLLCSDWSISFKAVFVSF